MRILGFHLECVSRSADVRGCCGDASELACVVRSARNQPTDWRAFPQSCRGRMASPVLLRWCSRGCVRFAGLVGCCAAPLTWPRRLLNDCSDSTDVGAHASTGHPTNVLPSPSSYGAVPSSMVALRCLVRSVPQVISERCDHRCSTCFTTNRTFKDRRRCSRRARRESHR